MNKIIVISDIDGCLTDGGLYYTADGKVMKKFGVGDHEGVKLLRKNNIDILFITADKTGYPIVKRRIDDMKCDLVVVNEIERLDFIKEYVKEYEQVVFFGDGLGDANVKNKIPEIYFITPRNARNEAKDVSDYITENKGSEGAFLDLAIHVSWKTNTYYNKLYE